MGVENMVAHEILIYGRADARVYTVVDMSGKRFTREEIVWGSLRGRSVEGEKFCPLIGLGDKKIRMLL